MPTLNQLIRHGREEKRRTDRTRASDQCPQKHSYHLVVLNFIDKNILFFKTTIYCIVIYCGFLLYTYDRSFRVHQDTLSRVLRWNNRQGLFCSQVHVGHDGTTLWFQPIPTDLGTAGPIDPSILAYPPELGLQFMGIDPSLFALITLALFLLILFLWSKKSKEKNQ